MSWRIAYAFIALLVIGGAVTLSVLQCGEWTPPSSVEAGLTAAPTAAGPTGEETPARVEGQETPASETPAPEAGAGEETPQATPTGEGTAEPTETPTPAAEKTPEPSVSPVSTRLADVLHRRLTADSGIADREISEAQRCLEQGDLEGASQYIRRARTAVVFVQTELPATLARQSIRRADVLAGSGKLQLASDALEEAAELASDVRLSTTLTAFRNDLANVRVLLGRGDGQRARELLGAMADAIAPSDAYTLALKIIEHLQGALSAIERRSPAVTKAEVEEAKSAMYQLSNAIEL